MEDEWFEGEITDYHLKKSKYRVLYDDGEHEWINLREEQDRVMIFYATEDLDGDGIIDDNDRVWLEFRFCRDPDAKPPGKTLQLLRMQMTRGRLQCLEDDYDDDEEGNGLNTSMTIRKNHIMSIRELENKYDLYLYFTK